MKLSDLKTDFKRIAMQLLIESASPVALAGAAILVLDGYRRIKNKIKNRKTKKE